ncbi:MAG: transglycosylase SLT domain-containing protein [Rhizobiales bacterium]|nr:transglycosylase SLT domain-containing protein [Hyphomicrobiales bacterium]
MHYVNLIAMAAMAATAFVAPAHARPSGLDALSGLSLYRAIARTEALIQGVPYSLVDAVMWIESRYDPHATGGVGEIGLMQIRPPTARLLGFRGTLGELRRPRINIRLGTRYLAGAWRLAKGDICTTVMKYRAGHGEHRFSVRSVEYCKKVRKYMRGGGYQLTGTVPKPTFGFNTGNAKRFGKGFVRAPRTPGCYARVVQPGARFGACIPLSKLLKKGLVVRVTRPIKRKK